MCSCRENAERMVKQDQGFKAPSSLLLFGSFVYLPCLPFYQTNLSFTPSTFIPYLPFLPSLPIKPIIRSNNLSSQLTLLLSLPFKPIICSI